MSARPAVAALLAAGLLAGCGFHLAGERPLPRGMQSVYIDFVDPYRVAEPPVEAALQKRIVQRGGQVKSKVEEAQTIIRLSELRERQEVLAIGPDGKAIEYRLVSSVRYEVDSGNRVILSPDTMIVSRDYSFSAQQILAKEVEQSRLRDYIQSDMADLLLLRVEAVMSRQAEALDKAAADADAERHGSPVPAVAEPKPAGP